MSASDRSYSDQERRVAITGIGVVSPIGRTADEFWEALSRPLSSAADEVCDPDSDQRGTARFSGRIEDFGDLPTAIRKTLRKSLKLMNRETQMGVAAGQQALLASGLLKNHEAERVGVCFGAGNVSVMPEDFQSGVDACSNDRGEFEIERWGTDGIAEVAPLWLLKCLPNMPTCHLAIINDLQGPNNTITQRDVSFALAIAEACRSIRSGDAHAMLVGATGTTLNGINLMHARLEDEVCDDACDLKPFPAEGAGALVLEDLHAARERGAHIYGVVLGSSSASFIGHDGASACGRALANSMRRSLRLAGLCPEGIGHIHAYGLGLPRMQEAESQAISDVFSSAKSKPPVVVTKHRLGHACAGTEAMEVIASLLAMEHGQLFPKYDMRPLMPDVREDDTQSTAGDSFLSLSMFGRGLGSAIVVGAYRE